MIFLVTGGAGFIGSHLVEELLERGYKVRVLDNLSTGREENISKYLADIEFIKGDIRDTDKVAKAVKGVNVILHQAALPSVPRSVKDPIASNDVNINGTLNLLWAAKNEGIERFVAASSSSVYGDNPELPKHEKQIPNPISPYAVTKITLEYYLKVFYEIYGLQTYALRYFNVFGPRQDPNSQYSAVIPKFITAMARNESPVIYGDGEQSRDFTFIKNVVNANILAATKGSQFGKAMNIAGNSRINLNELISEINLLLNRNIKPNYTEPRQGDILHSFASVSYAEELIGYRPEYDFKTGLKITSDWYSKDV